MFSKLAAECVGTFWLVLGGCGSAGAVLEGEPPRPDVVGGMSEGGSR